MLHVSPAALGSAYFIAEARLEDTDQIVSLVNTAYWSYQRVYFEETPDSLRTNANEVLEHIQEKKVYVLIENDTQRIIGSILYENMSNACSFGLFAVDPDPKYKGKRLGNLLIDFVERKAVIHNVEKIKIEVLGFAESLQGYYSKLGFVQTGESHRFQDVSKASLKAELQSSKLACYKVMEKDLLGFKNKISLTQS